MAIVVGDVGGTKTLLAVAEAVGGQVRFGRQERYRSDEFDGLGAMVRAFLARGKNEEIDRACFAVAAPVLGESASGPNMPWGVHRASLIEDTGIARVEVINDFYAVGRGIPHLGRDDLSILQEGRREERGPIAVLGAGTGLGAALLLWCGDAYQVHPTEGGHADFAPRNALEWGLLQFLREKLSGRVSVERVLSGSGLADIYRYLVEREIVEGEEDVLAAMEREDPAAVVSGRALAGKSEGCERALDLFISLYGAEAGNMALRVLATGGVYVAGGIAPRIAERMAAGGFLRSFTGKGRFASFLEGVPVSLISSPRAPLIGAAAHIVPAL